MEDEARHIQISLFTKQERHAIPETPFSVAVTARREELTTLVDQCLHDTLQGEEKGDVREFDFFISGELIRGTLEQHISHKNIPQENVIRIEYVERSPPPSLSDVLDHRDWVSCVHCSEKFILTGCYDGNVRVWNRNGDLLCVASGHNAPVKSVLWISDAPSEDPLFLSASQDQHVNVWRLSSTTSQPALLHQCKGHARSVEDLAVSPDGSKFCSVSWDKLLKVWSAVPDTIPSDEVEDDEDLPAKKPRPLTPGRSTTRTPLLTLSGHHGAVTCVVWREEGLVSAGWDHCIRVWDVPTGVNTNTLTGSKAFHDIDQSPFQPSLLASASSDKYIRLWDTRQAETSMVQGTLSSHKGWVVAVQWSPETNNHLVSGSYDSTVRVWDTRSHKVPLYTIAAHEGKVLCIEWSKHKILASGGTDNKLRTYMI